MNGWRRLASEEVETDSLVSVQYETEPREERVAIFTHIIVLFTSATLKRNNNIRKHFFIFSLTWCCNVTAVSAPRGFCNRRMFVNILPFQDGRQWCCHKRECHAVETKSNNAYSSLRAIIKPTILVGQQY